ncbi:MAG: phosphatase PAP2 family protein [Candidatus Nanoarchaeia archaeon]
MKKRYLFFLGLIIFVVSFFFDKSAAMYFSSFRHPVFDYIAWFFSYTIISIAVFFVIPFLIFWFKDRNYALLYAISFGLVMLFTYLIKFLVMRPRPYTVLDIPMIALLSYQFAWFNTSFPSSHASASFAAVAGAQRFKLCQIWMFIALLAGLSRLYAGLHYLSDIVGGALLGFFVVHLVLWLDKRYKFSKLWKKALS